MVFRALIGKKHVRGGVRRAYGCGGEHHDPRNRQGNAQGFDERLKTKDKRQKTKDKRLK